MNDLKKPPRRSLLGLDVVFLVTVFNLVRYCWGLGDGVHWIVLPLLGPLAALVFAIYLIDGYRARTDMMSRSIIRAFMRSR